MQMQLKINATGKTIEEVAKLDDNDRRRVCERAKDKLAQKK
jgi:hypothetical protein